MTDVVKETEAAEAAAGPVQADAVDEQLVRQLGERARAEGLQLTGEGGLLARLTKMVVESALEGEMEDHLGYTRHDPAGRDGGNSRNGTRAKELLTEAGPVQIAVPRDRDGSFTPQLVKKRQRRLSGLDDLVISLSAKGLTHGEICAHLAEVYGAEVSKQTISTITEKALEGLAACQNRPPGLSGHLHRRGEREDPRRAGREPAGLRGAGGDRRGHPGHPGTVGRRARRRGGGEVLDAGALGDQEPGHPGLPDRGL